MFPPICVLNVAMDYDGVLRHLGERGPWNARGHAVIWAIVFASGTVYLTYSFTGGSLMCYVSDSVPKLTRSAVPNLWYAFTQSNP